MLVGRQNKCFYGTRIKTECSIPYVITRFDEDHLDRMSHSERVHVQHVSFVLLWTMKILLTFPKNLVYDETFCETNQKQYIYLMREFHDVEHNLQIPRLVL